MAPLHVVVVMPFFAWRLGGSVEQMRQSAAALARRGHRVTVLTTDLGVDAQGEPQVPGVEVHRVAARGLAARPPYRAPRALLALLDRHLAGADVVTTHVGLTLLNVAAERRATAAGVPFVYCAANSLSPALLAQKRWRKWLFVRLCERPLLRRVAALQALSDTEVEDLVRQGAPRQRIVVVPNGIDVDALGRGDAAAARARLGLPQQRLIVFLGRLAPEKGLELMLAAAAPLLREDAELRLVLAGPDGGMAKAVRAQARRLGIDAGVCLCGPVPPDQRGDLFAATAVFAHTSRAEGQPLSVIEAAAAGCPLWLTSGCNLPEVATAGAGTVDAADAALLTASLRRLLSSRDGEPWRSAARRLARERFSVAETAARLEALYRSVARR